ncbi:hypothetical protein BH09ACT4_BH09ACT4_03970 [soil metagenome]
MNITAGDQLIHKASKFAGVVIGRQTGGDTWYWAMPIRGNINVVALMTVDGEVRFFDADELSLDA